MLSSQKINKNLVDEEGELLPADRTDAINRDLEDDNFLPNDAIDVEKDPEVLERLIPRNL